MRFLNRITIARGRNDNAGHPASLCGYGLCQLPAEEGDHDGTCEIRKRKQISASFLYVVLPERRAAGLNGNLMLSFMEKSV